MGTRPPVPNSDDHKKYYVVCACGADTVGQRQMAHAHSPQRQGKAKGRQMFKIVPISKRPRVKNTAKGVGTERGEREREAWSAHPRSAHGVNTQLLSFRCS